MRPVARDHATFYVVTLVGGAGRCWHPLRWRVGLPAGSGVTFRQHPGEILQEEFLDPYGLSADQLAIVLGVHLDRISGITGDTAAMLGRAFGTSPELWLNLQARYDLDLARAVAP